MGKISGQVVARCKTCNCRYIWALDPFPFVDAEIVGTCDDCFNKRSHNCLDELQLDENECFVTVGRKVFKKGEEHTSLEEVMAGIKNI